MLRFKIVVAIIWSDNQHYEYFYSEEYKTHSRLESFSGLIIPVPFCTAVFSCRASWCLQLAKDPSHSIFVSNLHFARVFNTFKLTNNHHGLLVSVERCCAYSGMTSARPVLCFATPRHQRMNSLIALYIMYSSQSVWFETSDYSRSDPIGHIIDSDVGWILVYMVLWVGGDHFAPLFGMFLCQPLFGLHGR